MEMAYLANENITVFCEKMKKTYTIKVIKRNTGPAGPPKPLRRVLTRPLSMVGTVNNWILERRENSRNESLFSQGKITAWNIEPKV
jgi:hypothetical protein